MSGPRAVSGLGPPADGERLASLPEADDLPPILHRLSDHPGTWWFASVEPDGDGGRFDLPRPHGTCYLAQSLEGALLEKVLRASRRVVPQERLEELLHARIEVRDATGVVDLTSPLAGLGLNAEIHAGLDYERPRAWAAALRAAGWRALRYLLRGDNALRSKGVARFGRAGLHRRAPTGLRTSLGVLDVDEAARLLEERGVLVLPVPSAAALGLHRQGED